jgi:hypothetical protein
MRLIESVHRSPGVPPDLPVQVVAFLVGAPHGDFDTRRIAINRKGPHPRLALVHEFGHALDYFAIGETGVYATASGSPELEPWRTAVEASAAVVELRARLSMVFTSAVAVPSPIGTYLRYLLQPRELFARSYAQWIALRSGSTDLREELDLSRSGEGPFGDVVQWSIADFNDIATALDKLFGSLGWLR